VIRKTIRTHDFTVSILVSSVAAETDTDSFGSANQQEQAQAERKNRS
jgi:hypothetical protein